MERFFRPSTKASDTVEFKGSYPMAKFSKKNFEVNAFNSSNYLPVVPSHDFLKPKLIVFPGGITEYEGETIVKIQFRNPPEGTFIRGRVCYETVDGDILFQRNNSWVTISVTNAIIGPLGVMHTDLLELLKNDTLVISFELCYSRCVVELEGDEKSFFKVSRAIACEKLFDKILEEEEMDATIQTADGSTVRAHSFLLRAGSLVMKNIIKGENYEGVIHESQYSIDVMRAIVQFFKYHNIPAVNEETLNELVPAAKKYNAVTLSSYLSDLLLKAIRIT